MKELTVKIHMGNDAMSCPEDAAKALRAIAKKLERKATAGKVMDENGNTVGFFDVEDE